MHVAEIGLDPGRTYRLAMNAWPAANDSREGLELTDVVARHLAS